jgi:hypothetical protein
MADEQTKPEPKSGSSGDHSGKGRPRRDDTDVFPQRRGRDQFGTHGGNVRKEAPPQSEPQRK